MATSDIPELPLRQFTELIAAHPEMEIKGGGKMKYTSMNGNMYTLLSKVGDAGLRMSKEDGAAFIDAYDAGPLISYGAVMKGYVQIPSNMLGEIKELLPWLDKCHEFAKTLKPKPTKK